ncbi:MAG: hypothetical protein ACYCOU_19380, partial [Sulfobacillus sp.]
MDIESGNYARPRTLAELARLDVVILNFYPGWNPDGRAHPVRDVLRVLRTLNPHILVGQYTILSEAQSRVSRYGGSRDTIYKLNEQDWWLRDAQGHKVQWTSRYHAYQTNITHWATPDFNGLR